MDADAAIVGESLGLLDDRKSCHLQGIHSRQFQAYSANRILKHVPMVTCNSNRLCMHSLFEQLVL
jgi:hypothetical protein